MAGVSAKILELAGKIRLLIMDVDGVLTDGQVYYGVGGEVAKAFYVRDGIGIKEVLKCGIGVAVISGRYSAGTKERLMELGVQHIYLGIKDKVACFTELQQQLQVSVEQVAYIGDDVPDLAMIQLVGLGVAVADAVQEVKAVARYVTKAIGGRGAVRELCDLIRQAQS